MRHATGRTMRRAGVAAGRVPRRCAGGVRIEQRELVRQRVVGDARPRPVEDEPTPTSGPPVPATVTDGKATIDVTVGHRRLHDERRDQGRERAEGNLR